MFSLLLLLGSYDSFFFCWFVCCTSYSGLLELQYIITGRVGLLQLTYATFAMDCCLLWMPPRALMFGFLQLAAVFCPWFTFSVLGVVFVYGFALYCQNSHASMAIKLLLLGQGSMFPLCSIMYICMYILTSWSPA